MYNNAQTLQLSAETESVVVQCSPHYSMLQTVSSPHPSRPRLHISRLIPVRGGGKKRVEGTVVNLVSVKVVDI